MTFASLWISAFLWLPRVGSFELDTPLPSTVTISQPFSFTWCRDNSDQASAYLQFGAFYGSNSLTGRVFNAGERKKGTYTMTPTVPGEFRLDGWSGYAANGENALQIGLLPHTVVVQTVQAQIPAGYEGSLPSQTQSSNSQATQTESPAQTSTGTGSGSEGFQPTSSPSSAPESGDEVPPTSTSNSSTDSKGSNHTGAIVGGVIGALLATIIFVALLLCIRRRKQGPYVLVKTRVTILSNIIGCDLAGKHGQDIVARPLSPSDYPNTNQKSRFVSARQFISTPRNHKLGEALRLPSTQSLSGTSRDAEPGEEIPPQFRARFQEMSQRVARLEAEIEMPPTYDAADADANGRRTQ
ncbi:hypothetical protein PQX77_021755 [Marasmius sp. AFHP31]|nr:hypothetical protein PQX77_021755 [Marasmius sp. AFHP31]